MSFIPPPLRLQVLEIGIVRDGSDKVASDQIPVLADESGDMDRLRFIAQMDHVHGENKIELAGREIQGLTKTSR